MIACVFLLSPAYAGEGEIVPNVRIKTMDGRAFDLHDMEEPVVLMHFWATWCAPCVAEFPKILKLLEAMDGRVALVAVSMDYKDAPLQRFVKRFDRDDLPLYWVHDKSFKLAYRDFKAAQVPETIIIGPERRHEGKIVGAYAWDGDAIRQRLTVLRVQSISQ